MLKFLLAAAPYVLKAPNKSSQKQIARSFTALMLFALSAIMITAASFIYIASVYGAAIGLLVVAAICLLGGLALQWKAKSANRAVVQDTVLTETSDPLAAYVPDTILQDPNVSKVIGQIKANPLTAGLAAATIGMLLTREIMKD